MLSSRLTRSFTLSCLLALCLGACAVAAEGVFSVKDFGAVGDGKADDTAAIQSALDKAKAGPRGSKVVVPAGTYRLTKTITVENCLLSGLEAGGWPADQGPLPTLAPDFTDGPCVNMRAAASIHGLNFEYDHKGEQARKFGPTIFITGNGVSITNLRIHQPYEAIMADGVTNIGRLNIENVFIISARKCGVYVSNTYDIPTLRNIEVWNVADYCLDNCIGFKLGKNDEIRLDNCFAFKCKVGFWFFEDKEGATWGGMTGCSVDYSVVGVLVEGNATLRITSGCLWCHSNSLVLDGPAKVVVSGVEMKANGDAALVVKRCKALNLAGCMLGKNGSDWPTVPAAKIEGGDSVLISGCTFDDNGPGVVIGEKADNFSITGNLFQPSPFEAITDKSPATASKMLASNLTRKMEPKKK